MEAEEESGVSAARTVEAEEAEAEGAAAAAPREAAEAEAEGEGKTFTTALATPVLAAAAATPLSDADADDDVTASEGTLSSGASKSIAPVLEGGSAPEADADAGTTTSMSSAESAPWFVPAVLFLLSSKSAAAAFTDGLEGEKMSVTFEACFSGASAALAAPAASASESGVAVPLGRGAVEAEVMSAAWADAATAALEAEGIERGEIEPVVVGTGETAAARKKLDADGMADTGSAAAAASPSSSSPSSVVLLDESPSASGMVELSPPSVSSTESGTFWRTSWLAGAGVQSGLITPVVGSYRNTWDACGSAVPLLPSIHGLTVSGAADVGEGSNVAQYRSTVAVSATKIGSFRFTSIGWDVESSVSAAVAVVSVPLVLVLATDGTGTRYTWVRMVFDALSTNDAALALESEEVSFVPVPAVDRTSEAIRSPEGLSTAGEVTSMYPGAPPISIAPAPAPGLLSSRR